MLNLFLPCPRGMETLLMDELLRVKRVHGFVFQNIRVTSGGVSLEGDSEAVMALNLHTRLASRVLIAVAHGAYHDEASLYQVATGVEWAAWFDVRHTLRVDVTAQRSPLRSLQFATLKVKDAICDVMRDATGERPSVDTVRPGVRVFAHLTETHATVYLDTSGEPLFKRGWRMDKGEAPLKETLAAAIIYASGWNGDTPLYDPCGGSGTLVIEAAQIAANIAPGLARPFGFERLHGYDAQAWNAIKTKAQQASVTLSTPLFCNDISFRMTDFAKRNAERAGVANFITFTTGDLMQLSPPAAGGTIVMNPPYGERIEVKGKGRGGRESYQREGEGEPAQAAQAFALDPASVTRAGRHGC
jgi:putative N6-adenine-specific DNA methylase